MYYVMDVSINMYLLIFITDDECHILTNLYLSVSCRMLNYNFN